MNENLKLLHEAKRNKATCILVTVDNGKVISNQSLLIKEILGDQIVFTNCFTLDASLIDFVVGNVSGQYVVQARLPPLPHPYVVQA